MSLEATELQKLSLVLMLFYWVWMDCSLLHVPQFLNLFFYIVAFIFSFIKLFVVVSRTKTIF